MSSHSRIVLAVHRALVRSSGTRLRRLWVWAYRLIARIWAAYLTWGERDAAVYRRGSAGGPDLVPGVSDVDLAVVLSRDPAGPGRAAARVHARRERLRRVFPPAAQLLDYPRVYEGGELRDAVVSCAFDHGLGESRPTGWFMHTSGELAKALERPGLYEPAADWRLLKGPERRPEVPARDAQARRMAAWLELMHWWRHAYALCAEPERPSAALLCVKLISEPARIWLWLAAGERGDGRGDALRRASELLPQESDAFGEALELNDALSRLPEPPIARVLPAFVRLSSRIAELIGAELEAAGSTEVRLTGTVAGSLPLLDWRGLVWPSSADERFVLRGGDAGDSGAIAAAAAAESGPYEALRAPDLLALPAVLKSRLRMRTLHCPATAPAMFALSAGEEVARFPEVRGWSAGDTARRAVAEHAPWLLSDPAARSALGGQAGALGRVFTAARAGLFREAIGSGEPELAVTRGEVARSIGEREGGAGEVAAEALAAYEEFAATGVRPSSTLVEAMRELVARLPAYTEAELSGSVSGASLPASST